MKIVYLGAFPPDFLIKRSAGKIDSLYRAYQSLIRGLKENNDNELIVITSPEIASWPGGPLFIRREHNEREGLTMVSSLNLPIAKQFWTILSMFFEVSRSIRHAKNKVIVIIPFLVFRHVFTLRLLHWLFPKKVIQACVVPDIFFPQKKINKYVNKFTEYLASGFDAYLLYTKKMAEHLHLKEGCYEVIEGYRELLERRPKPSKVFCVVYAGSLNLNYGVGRLVEAMQFVKDQDVQLHLYGAGSAVKLIEETSKRDKRIVFHGKVPNSIAVDAIYSASVLVNPRNAKDGKYTEYSFPSKDIEYMATGTPTLLCKLPGMPTEYYGHFVDLGSGTPKEIASAIMKVKAMTPHERGIIGEDSKNFIKERMNYKKQGEKIVKLFCSIINNKSI